MRNGWVLALFVSLASGCALDASGVDRGVDRDESSSDDSIIGGRREYRENAVVALVSHSDYDRDEPGHAICSGVLITPTVVLTAAHCRRAARYVVVGPNVDTGTRYRVEDFERPRSFKNPDDNFDEARDDIAFVTIRTCHEARDDYECGPIANVEPMPLGVEPREGQEVSIIGYGCTLERTRFSRCPAAADVGIRHSRLAVLDDHDRTFMEVNERRQDDYGTLGPGDSGGPILRDGRVVGVASHHPPGGLQRYMQPLRAEALAWLERELVEYGRDQGAACLDDFDEGVGNGEFGVGQCEDGLRAMRCVDGELDRDACPAPLCTPEPEAPGCVDAYGQTVCVGEVADQPGCGARDGWVRECECVMYEGEAPTWGRCARVCHPPRETPPSEW